METTLIIVLALVVIFYGYLYVVLSRVKKRSSPHFYNKQGQECSQSEMEAELRPHKYPKKWPIEIPEEEAFD